MDNEQARSLAVQWLARREYSRRELCTRLIGKGCASPVADQVASDLEASGLLSDERFVESLIRARRTRGYGPLRIQRELQEKGVAPDVIGRWIDCAAPDWIDDLRRVQRRKYGARKPSSLAERARQTRFLQYRGFTFEQIQRVLSQRERD